KWGGKVGLWRRKPVEVFVQSGVCRYILLARHLPPGIQADNPPPLGVETTDMPGNSGKLPSDAPVVRSPVILDAAAKFYRIEHRLPDHLEDLALKNMRSDLRIAASLDLASIMVVLSGATITAIYGLMIHADLSRGLYDLVVSP